MKIEFPILYKKTATGAVQFWKVSVEEDGNTGRILTTFGQVGTNSPQYTVDVVSSGKNAGKKNATTAFEQAKKEAEASWDKKKKKGYVESLSEASSGAVDTSVIKGGVSPMLAEKFSEQGHKILFPCYAQPKLDGARCIAVMESGKATLWTRTRKPITSVPHIISALENKYPGQSMILDGELYNHEIRNTTGFEKLMSVIRKNEPGSGYEQIQYHVYDTVRTEEGFSERLSWLRKNIFTDGPVVLVETIIVSEEAALLEYFTHCIKNGYEGVMARNSSGKYANRRSCDLQKVKEFDDKEFMVVGIKEGRGKLAGHAGSFICRLAEDSGATFDVKLQGELKNLKMYFEDASLAIGKMLKVKFHGYTEDKKPRFPVGICFRDSEDF